MIANTGLMKDAALIYNYFRITNSIYVFKFITGTDRIELMIMAATSANVVV